MSSHSGNISLLIFFILLVGVILSITIGVTALVSKLSDASIKSSTKEKIYLPSSAPTNSSIKNNGPETLWVYPKEKGDV